MCAHDVSLRPLQTLKWVHNDEPLTKKARLSYHDDDEAGIVPRILAQDGFFIERTVELAKVPMHDRTDQAKRIARAYTPYRGLKKGLHQDLIAGLLLCAASAVEEGRSSAEVELRLVNYHRRPIWAEAELDELDGRRKRERWITLEQGAQRLARLGAGVYIDLDCSTRLAKDRWPSSGEALLGTPAGQPRDSTEPDQ
jgi:hypothetical protein